MAKKVKIQKEPRGIFQHLTTTVIPGISGVRRHQLLVFVLLRGDMDCGIITISTYMAPCAPAQQHTGESLASAQTDEACSRTIANTIHMDIWGFCFYI